ncbi:hypothetical protein PO242_22785 [Bacteroides ovatus]|jgi:sugar O-acyltransferase (sialic acid O-acetyltransferase NeuD family)|uniref:PglD-related sugar-binding protein n=1 Tax=Bacteroides ovatus TaxID=28116 RepID=UPI00189AD979|nr:hypothetical protein [Bacteroides ovatus]MDC2648959.1 hypothetical protein [Bacteroides ovatus]
MEKQKILLYGIGSLGEKIVEYNKRDKMYDIVAFVDDKKGVEPTFCGLPVINYDTCKKQFDKSEYKIFVSIGYVRCNYYRELICKRVVADGYELINYVSPNSICFDNVLVGKNILVCDNVFVGHGSKIHDGVILSVGTTLSHENIVEDYTFISSCVAFGGHAHVKNNCFVGLHSTVRDAVVIEEYNIVGSGTNVIKSTLPNSVTVGNPGKSVVKDTMNMSI